MACRFSTHVEGGVAPADHGHFLPGDEGEVLHVAVEHPLPLELLLAGNAERAAAHAGGNDQAVRTVHGVVGEGHPKPLVDPLDRLRLRDAMVHVVGAQELVHELVDQLRAGDEVVAHVVADLAAVDRLAAEVPGDQEGVEHQQRRVDGGGQPGRAPADDDQVVVPVGPVGGPSGQELLPASFRAEEEGVPFPLGPGRGPVGLQLHAADGILDHVSLPYIDLFAPSRRRLLRGPAEDPGGRGEPFQLQLEGSRAPATPAGQPQDAGAVVGRLGVRLPHETRLHLDPFPGAQDGEAGEVVLHQVSHVGIHGDPEAQPLRLFRAPLRRGEQGDRHLDPRRAAAAGRALRRGRIGPRRSGRGEQEQERGGPQGQRAAGAPPFHLPVSHALFLLPGVASRVRHDAFSFRVLRRKGKAGSPARERSR